MRSFVKIKHSRNGKITLSFVDIGKSCLSREFFISYIYLLMLFAKIKFSRKFPNLQYILLKTVLIKSSWPSDQDQLCFELSMKKSCIDSGSGVQCMTEKMNCTP